MSVFAFYFPRYTWRFSLPAGKIFHLRCPYIHLPCRSGNKITIWKDGSEVYRHCYLDGDRREIDYKLQVHKATVLILRVSQIAFKYVTKII